ncbi:hypothetical protein [uncultured Paraglaciecola sp.]|uniref:hypothetical protein n=1 Tax=uncultured Paraglaciecola sp. TaxID=1765024 RepID=UPI0030DCB8BA
MLPSTGKHYYQAWLPVFNNIYLISITVKKEFNVRKITTLLLVVSPLAFGADLPNYVQDPLCNEAGRIFAIDNIDSLAVIGAFENIIKTENNRYVEVGETLKIRAHQNHHISWEDGYPQYKTTRKFSYFSGRVTLTMLVNQTTNEDYDIAFNDRGRNYVSVIAKDKEIRQKEWDPVQSKYVDGYFVPLCEVIQVWAHEKPSVTNSNASGGSSISANVSGVILDRDSKAMREGNGKPSINWRFRNENWNTIETITTSTTSISFRPQLNGPYDIKAVVSDGTLTTTHNIGSVMYNGGEDCSNCGQIP